MQYSRSATLFAFTFVRPYSGQRAEARTRNYEALRFGDVQANRISPATGRPLPDPSCKGGREKRYGHKGCKALSSDGYGHVGREPIRAVR